MPRWVRVRRYRCTGCGHVWREDTTAAGAPRAKLSHLAVLWALKSVVIGRLSMTRVAASLGASWHTDNEAVLAAGRAPCSLTTRPGWRGCGSSAWMSTACATLAPHPLRRPVRHGDRPDPSA